MRVQVLDCDYKMLHGKPLLRIFGKTEDGEAVCVFYDKFLPYFYVHAEPEKFDKLAKELSGKFNIRTEIVEKYLAAGYGDKVKLLKITGKDPGNVPEMREIASKYGTPYEADILFRYRFMADHGIKGMGWIEVDGHSVRTDTVKCRTFHAERIWPVDVQKNVPLKYMAVDIETIPEGDGAPQAGKDEVIMISLAFSPAWKGNKQVVLLARHFGKEGVIGADNELEMLKKFMEIVEEYDPDIITGYNINGFDMPFIVERMRALGLNPQLGRSEKPVLIRKIQAMNVVSVVGRVVADTYEVIRRDPWMKFKRYNLGTVARELLKTEKLEIGGPADIKAHWNGGPERLHKLLDYSFRDSELALRLVTEKRLLDKFFELAKASGLLLQDTFGGQAQRHECKLLHVFRERDIVMPCRPDGHEMRRRSIEREKLGLKGAIVLEPEVGLHTGGCVLVLDFASLYPSIIRSFNICPTTYVRGDTAVKCHTAPNGARFVDKEEREGVLPAVVREWIETRTMVKKEMKTETDPERRRQLNAKQLALKDMANSVAGETDIVVIDPAGNIKVVEIGELFSGLEKRHPIKKLNSAVEVIELRGWRTLSVDGNRAQFRPLYAISRHKNTEQLIKIRTKMGEVKVTNDHSIIQMLGKAENKVKECRFDGLGEIKGGDVTPKTIIAQVKTADIPSKDVRYLNLVEILSSLPDKDIDDIYLYIPKSLNLKKRCWFSNRARLFSRMVDLGGKADSQQLQNDGFGRRILRTTEGRGLERVGLTTVGNCGLVPVYDVTEEGLNYLPFYELFKDAQETARYDIIPMRALRGARIPAAILNASKIATGGKFGMGRRKLPCVIPVSKELAELFGWFVAEGSTSKTVRGKESYYKASIVCDDKNVLKRLRTLGRKIFGYDAGLYSRQLSFNIKVLYLLFRRLCGERAGTKKIPDFIINSNREIRQVFLAAYTAGDGDADGRRLSTKSKRLAAQLAFLLKETGHILHSGQDSGVLRVSKRTFARGEKIVSGDLFGQPPVEIKTVDSPEYVYDLSVERTEKFVTAQGIVLHNSLYGYTGYIRSRLYVMDVAGAITSYGRDNITKTKDIIEKNFNVKVLYGDTDSIFMKTDIADLERAQAKGEEISAFVTARLPGLRFAFEKIFRTFLILSKKRYAGWAFEKTHEGWKDRLEMKGIETVRRDWADITTETMSEVLRIILKEQDAKKAITYTRSVIKGLAEGKVPLEKLTVVKGVTKSLDAYDGMQPHVELAKKIRARDPSKGSMVGERLGYVIIRGNALLSKRAEDPAYVKAHKLEIDSQYYIDNQLLPPLERIFDALGVSRAEVIEGTRQRSLAEMLGGKSRSPEQTILDSWENIVCRRCDWSASMPSLSGVCPKCGDQIFFSRGGQLGKFVKAR